METFGKSLVFFTPVIKQAARDGRMAVLRFLCVMGQA